MEYSSKIEKTERSMVRAMCGVQLKDGNDRKIHGESNMWGTAQR